MAVTVTTIEVNSAACPSALRDGMAVAGVGQRVWAIGNLQILDKPLLGFFCSTKYPGEVILRTYDLARALREARVAMIGGFHTPMEKECLALLLRGTQPMVICPARSIGFLRGHPQGKGRLGANLIWSD